MSPLRGSARVLAPLGAKEHRLWGRRAREDLLSPGESAAARRKGVRDMKCRASRASPPQGPRGGVQDFDRAACMLPRFRAEVWNELVFVCLDPVAPSLTDFLGDLVSMLARRDYSGFRLAHRKEWYLDCNWKVYVDNYLEGYHIPIVHPGLFREIDYPNYRTETRRNFSIQFAPLRRPERIAASSPGDEVEYFWLFPNLMLNVYPDNFSTNLIVPVGPNRTLTVFEWFFRDPDAVRTRVDETIAFSDEIQLEDIGICEAVQRGLRSTTYVSGRYSPQRENGVHHFHQLYCQAMA